MGPPPATVFADRADAGRRLAALLGRLGAERPVVLGLPRGGVPVAAEVARALGAPLDVVLVRKLGVPYQPELAAGAVGEDGVRVLNEDVRRLAGVSRADLQVVEARERATLDRMARTLRGRRPQIPLADRTVVIVDDGIATGSTARAACQVARARGAARLIVAAPVIPPQAHTELRGVADDVVCVESPEPFFSIGQWYEDFTQTTDHEVVELLDVARVRPAGTDEPISIGVASGVSLPGQLTVPPCAAGLVVFAHGSGSSRLSPRNQEVARRLQGSGIGTLLFDLLTSEEAEDRSHVFDVAMLSARLTAATTAVHELDPSLPIAYFGASTGAAAALWAAAEPGASVAAVVGRGGRPDLAGQRLGDVRAPTLLVVGGDDPEVLALNRRALEEMRCERKLVVVEAATHLFEEPGMLERVADLASDWFAAHFSGQSRGVRARPKEGER